MSLSSLLILHSLFACYGGVCICVCVQHSCLNSFLSSHQEFCLYPLSFLLFPSPLKKVPSLPELIPAFYISLMQNSETGSWCGIRKRWEDRCVLWKLVLELWKGQGFSLQPTPTQELSDVWA